MHLDVSKYRPGHHTCAPSRMPSHSPGNLPSGPSRLACLLHRPLSPTWVFPRPLWHHGCQCDPLPSLITSNPHCFYCYFLALSCVSSGNPPVPHTVGPHLNLPCVLPSPLQPACMGVQGATPSCGAACHSGRKAGLGLLPSSPEWARWGCTHVTVPGHLGPHPHCRYSAFT